MLIKTRKLTFREVQPLLVFILLGFVLVAGLIALNWWVAKQYGTGADFLPAWNGARAFIFDNTDPYSKTVAEQTQVVVYGRAARTGEYPYMLDIPFPLQLLFFPPLLIIKYLSHLFPAVTIPDVAWVRAIWMSLSEFGLMLLPVFALRLADWRPSRWFTVLLLVFSLIWFYSLNALLDGSFSVLLVLALVGALIAIRDFNDELAGFLLAISAMKWEITLLLWLLIIISAYSSRRWRVFAGMGMTWIVLGVMSFLIYPNWFWPFMRAVATNQQFGDLLSPSLFLEEWFPGFGKGIALLLVSVLLLILVIEWFIALRGRDFRRIAWAAAFAIAITPLLGFSIPFANLAPLVFSMAFILPFIWERWEKHPYLFISFLVFLLFALPLILHWPDIAPRIPANGLAFFLPSLFLILSLYWIRWTLVRPPRTWLDGVKRELRK